MFDAANLGAAIASHGPVVRVVVAGVEGSAPREVGAAMLVWESGQSGTIGGGALEWQAVQKARRILASNSDPRAPLSRGRGDGGEALAPNPDHTCLDRIALGPSLGQCCGGAVTLVSERWEKVPSGPHVARSLDGSAMPLAVKRLLAQARGQGVLPDLTLIQGWLVEPVARPSRQVWVWGAGHVGRALVAVLAPLPGIALTWVDVAPDRFPEAPGVRILPAPDPALAVQLAPKDAEHLIVTFSHALDLDLCHRLLTHGFDVCGLIGSATKWVRFRSRLSALGHGPDQVARITCPIGDPGLGKHPQAIAISVAGQLLGKHIRPGQLKHG